MSQPSQQQSEQDQAPHTGNGVPPTFIQHVRQNQLKSERRKQMSEQMSRDIAAGCTTGIGHFIGRLLFAPLAAWMFMVLVGVAHNSWVAALPTIGYWTALAITALTIVIRSLLRPVPIKLPGNR